MTIPALGICGWSGAGKTTLIEHILPRLVARGLAVAVVKHDAHGLEIDRPGKDTDRFFRAGATTVHAYDKEQYFSRSCGPNDLHAIVRRASAQADLVLVEGGKESPIPKLWPLHPDHDGDAPAADGVLAILQPGPQHLEQAETLVLNWLEKQWRERDQWFGILVGGTSQRMGLPKTLLRLGHRTLSEAIYEQACEVFRNIAFLGQGPIPPALRNVVPTIPDVPGVGGPLSGLLAAMRWNDSATWTIVACDMPRLNAQFLQWLQSQRQPGVWAILPQMPTDSCAQPLAAIYEPQARFYVETLLGRESAALREIVQFPKVRMVSPPNDLAASLTDANTPGEWEALVGRAPTVGTNGSPLESNEGSAPAV